MHISVAQKRGQVTFPEFTGERVYMREFRKQEGLPFDLARWQPTVDAMLAGIDAPGPVYIMIDQGVIAPGASHRRPGLHIDGYWIAATRSHDGRGGHGSSANPGSWKKPWSHCDFSTPEALILASDVSASRALVGVWSGDCGEGGDCSHINTEGLSEIVLGAGEAYAGNVTMLHESLPVASPTKRTLVRLSVPGWTPEV